MYKDDAVDEDDKEDDKHTDSDCDDLGHLLRRGQDASLGGNRMFT